MSVKHLSMICNVSTADSMGNSIPKPEGFIKALLWWLSARFGHNFAFLGRKLPVGSQRDNTSCGFFAMNAISHDAFGTDLLMHRDIRKDRLAWFNNLCKEIIQPVISIASSLNHGNVDNSQHRITPSQLLSRVALWVPQIFIVAEMSLAALVPLG